MPSCKPKKKILHALKVDEISGVDRPAQAPAKVVIMKRATDQLEKNAALTTGVNGHSHLIPLMSYVYSEKGEMSEEEEAYGVSSYNHDHTHPWVRTSTGEIVIGTTEGHTHDIEAIGKYEDLEKRAYSSDERESLAESGKALPDGSYPIVTVQDLKNALRAFGRAKNKAEVARHIKRRAKALGATDLLPTEGKLADLLKNSAETAGVPGQLEETMTQETKKAEELQAQIDQLQAELSKAISVAELSDSHKAHYKTLEGESAGQWLAKSAEEREVALTAITKAVEDGDPIVYTTREGIAIRKSAGETTLALVKAADEVLRENAELKKAQEQEAFQKRASEELSHLPGELAVHVAILKAVDGIEDQSIREQAHAALKSHNGGMEKATKMEGHLGQPSTSSASDDLSALVKAYSEEKSVSLARAYNDVLKTPEGQKLYNEM